MSHACTMWFAAHMRIFHGFRNANYKFCVIELWQYEGNVYRLPLTKLGCPISCAALKNVRPMTNLCKRIPLVCLPSKNYMNIATFSQPVKTSPFAKSRGKNCTARLAPALMMSTMTTLCKSLQGTPRPFWDMTHSVKVENKMWMQQDGLVFICILVARCVSVRQRSSYVFLHVYLYSVVGGGKDWWCITDKLFVQSHKQFCGRIGWPHPLGRFLYDQIAYTYCIYWIEEGGFLRRNRTLQNTILYL